MKKAAKTTKKTTKPAAKTTPAVKLKPIATPRAPKKSLSQDLPMWVKVLAIILIILGYVVYRLWGIAKVDSVTISRMDYYRAMEQQVGEQTLQKLIEETLIFEAARKQNYVIDQQAIDDDIATVSAQIIAQGSSVEEVLEAERLTMADVRRMYELDQIVKTLGRGDVDVSNEEVAAYIDDNKEDLPTTLAEAELITMIREQLEGQKASQNIATWVENLKAEALIIRY